MGDVLFRVNAGPMIGLGHLQRDLSLAMALRQSGATSVFLVNREPAAHEWVRRCGFHARTMGHEASWSSQDADTMIACARAEGCRIIVVDSDDAGAEYLGRVRRAGFWVCAIEDLAPHPFPCQVVVNGDVHAQKLPYASSSGDTVFLLGPAYSMLRREFWSLPQRAAREIPEHILVMLGGDDPHHLMPDILRMLDGLPGPFAITAVIGPFFDRVEDVEAVAARVSHPVRLVHAPESVRGLMMDADLAVSAGGQTLYELARVGCPTVAFCSAGNQAGQLGAFHDAGSLCAVGHAADPTLLPALRKAVASLLTDGGARAAMRAAGQRLVDGQGALRVAGALMAALSQGSPVAASAG